MAGSLPIQSVARAAEILKHVGGSADGLTLQQLSEKLGLKGPTVHHLARTLVEAGLLEKSAGPVRYRIGQALIDIAHTQAAGHTLRVAERVMLRLADRLPQATLTYSEPSQGQVLTRLRIAAENPGVVQRPTDLVLSAYSSASALLFQSLWPAAQRLAFQSQNPFEEFGGNWPSLDALAGYLEKTRALGQAVRPGGPGRALAVASPVNLPDGRLVGCIGAAVSSNSSSPALTGEQTQTVCRAVAESAEEITAELAGHHNPSARSSP